MQGSRSFSRWFLSAACMGVCLSPSIASAQTLQSCLATQLQYAGTACRGMAKCYVKPMRRGLAVDPFCVPARESELGSRFLNVESMGGCLVEPAGPTTADMVSDAVDGLADSLTVAGGKCAAGKMGGLGRACKQLFRCYTNAVYDSSPVDPFCLGKASSKVMSIFDRMESRFGSSCATLGDAAARSNDIVTLADDVHTYLRGTGSTTTSTTVFSTSTTTLLTGSCPEDGSFAPCEAYRDNPACTSCVDMAGGIAASQCTGAGPLCADSFQNQACGYTINTATSCGAVCCP